MFYVFLQVGDARYDATEILFSSEEDSVTDAVYRAISSCDHELQLDLIKVHNEIYSHIDKHIFGIVMYVCVRTFFVCVSILW